MNSNVQQRADEEIANLLYLADDLVQTAKGSSNRLSPEEIGRVTTWLSRIGQFIRKLYGKDSQHFENFKYLIDHKEYTNLHSSFYMQLCQMRGILEAIQYELKAGLIADFRKLLQASVFAAFSRNGRVSVVRGF